MSDKKPELEIITDDYEAEHGKKPAHNKKGDWHFYVPSAYGKRAWLWLDVTYSQATKELKSRAHSGGTFRLAP